MSKKVDARGDVGDLSTGLRSNAALMQNGMQSKCNCVVITIQ